MVKPCQQPIDSPIWIIPANVELAYMENYDNGFRMSREMFHNSILGQWWTNNAGQSYVPPAAGVDNMIAGTPALSDSGTGYDPSAYHNTRTYITTEATAGPTTADTYGYPSYW